MFSETLRLRCCDVVEQMANGAPSRVMRDIVVPHDFGAYERDRQGRFRHCEPLYSWSAFGKRFGWLRCAAVVLTSNVVRDLLERSEMRVLVVFLVIVTVVVSMRKREEKLGRLGKACLFCCRGQKGEPCPIRLEP